MDGRFVTFSINIEHTFLFMSVYLQLADSLSIKRNLIGRAMSNSLNAGIKYTSLLQIYIIIVYWTEAFLRIYTATGYDRSVAL
jgi:hypothetical protein